MPDAVKWITKLSFMTFGYNALMVNEFNGISILINPTGPSFKNPVTIEGALLLEQVGMRVSDLIPDLSTFINLIRNIIYLLLLVVLACMLVIYLVASYVALRYAVKERR